MNPTPRQLDILWQFRIPARGLNSRQAGFIIGAIVKNGWSIPEEFSWFKNSGTLRERLREAERAAVARADNEAESYRRWIRETS